MSLMYFTLNIMAGTTPAYDGFIKASSKNFRSTLTNFMELSYGAISNDFHNFGRPLITSPSKFLVLCMVSAMLIT